MQTGMVGEMSLAVEVVELPRCWYWKKLLDCQRSFIREFSARILREGIKSPEQFHRLLYLLSYAEITHLLDKEEHHKAFDLASEWVLCPKLRYQKEYELLLAVPWKLICDERKFSFD